MQGYKMDKADRTLRAVMTHVESKRRERERMGKKEKEGVSGQGLALTIFRTTTGRDEFLIVRGHGVLNVNY